MEECIWITGGGSGLGAVLARKLARQGRLVVISGRRADELAEVAALEPRLRPLALDVADSVAVQNGVQRIEREIGPISMAVLNAGLSSPAQAAPLDPDRMQGVIDVNLGGTLTCLAALVPALRRRGAGHVAILSSAASKAGLTALAESLSRDLADSGVSLQVVNPGSGGADKAADQVLKALKSASKPRRVARLMKLLRRWLTDPVYFHPTHS